MAFKPCNVVADLGASAAEGHPPFTHAPSVDEGLRVWLRAFQRARRHFLHTCLLVIAAGACVAQQMNLSHRLRLVVLCSCDPVHR